MPLERRNIDPISPKNHPKKIKFSKFSISLKLLGLSAQPLNAVHKHSGLTGTPALRRHHKRTLWGRCCWAPTTSANLMFKHRRRSPHPTFQPPHSNEKRNESCLYVLHSPHTMYSAEQNYAKKVAFSHVLAASGRWAWFMKPFRHNLFLQSSSGHRFIDQHNRNLLLCLNLTLKLNSQWTKNSKFTQIRRPEKT